MNEATFPDKEVFFFEYCPKCVNNTKPESCDECSECLSNPSNTNSHKPVNFKEKQ